MPTEAFIAYIAIEPRLLLYRFSLGGILGN